MKSILLSLMIVLFSSSSLFSQTPTTNKTDNEDQFIEWFGENEIANSYVGTGVWHLLNVENEKAFSFFIEALEQDSSLFAPHVALAWMSWGATRDYHVAKAKEKVKDKNDVSKLFVSLLDLDSPREGDAYPIWKKMHELAPKGNFVHYYYARSIPDSEESLAEMEYLLNAQKTEKWTPHIHNALGYLHYRSQQKDLALEHFQTYVVLYPTGYNPYDSMGEYYLNEGNKVKAVEYFTKAVEHFPGAVNAIQLLDKIELGLDSDNE